MTKCSSSSGKGFVSAKYCDIQGGYSGEGNIDKDPLFVDVAKGNYHLQSASPCVNMGTDSGVPITDIDNENRPQGFGYDIGADEHICADADADGYYVIAGCGAEIDCDDTNATVHPNGAKINYYPDADGDGYGNIDLPVQSCCPPAGYILDNTDCKDTDSTINPGAKDLCDGVNNDCDWKVDEDYDVGASCSTGIGACKRDGEKVCKADGSGTLCNAVAGKPNAEISCDGIDNDCDGQVDEIKDKIASMSVSPSSFTSANIGANKVVLTITDAGGNKSVCTSTVIVQAYKK